MPIVKVNQIASYTGNTLTVGTTGDTVTLASGATSSGFGATYNGAINWDTTPKTTTVTAVSGNGYFINTTSGAVTINLPATPTAGNVVAIADYNGTAATNSITVGRNGSNINGSALNFSIDKNYSSVTFVYVDSTSGWRSVETSNTTDTSNTYIAATGGTITTSGNYKIHTFTGPGTFTVCSVGSSPTYNIVSYLVVGGGGGNYGGPGIGSGGGGAGGFRESKAPYDSYTASPLASSGGTPVTATSYPITVGAGGSGSSNGSPTSVFSITSAGGGYGNPRGGGGASGGSGGGGGDFAANAGGAGNTPPVSPSQGNPGFSGAPGEPSGGGGGAGTGGPTSTQSAAPGLGVATSIQGTSFTHSAGGDGEGPGCTQASAPIRNAGGHGMGSGGTFPGSPQPTASSQAGVVVIRYKYQ